MRLDAVVHVEMVLKRGDRLESALAHLALVRPVLRVGLQVAVQQVARWTGTELL